MTAEAKAHVGATSAEHTTKTNLAVGRWTVDEHNRFLEGLDRFGTSWLAISELVQTRTPVQARTHHQKYVSQLRRGRRLEPYDTNTAGKRSSGGRRHTTTVVPTTDDALSSSAPPVASDNAIVPAAAVVRGKRLTRLQPAGGGSGGRGRGQPRRSIRARKAAAAKAAADKAEAEASTARAAAPASAAAGRAGSLEGRDDETGGGFEGPPEGGRFGKRLKIERPSSSCSSSSSSSRALVSADVTPPEVVCPSSADESALLIALWSSMGQDDGGFDLKGVISNSSSRGGGTIGQAGASGAATVSTDGALARQLTPLLSDSFVDGSLAIDSEMVQPSPSSSSTSSMSLPLSRGGGGGGREEKSKDNARFTGPRSVDSSAENDGGYLLGAPALQHAVLYGDRQRILQKQRLQRERLRYFQQQQQQQQQLFVLSAAGAAPSSMPLPLFGGDFCVYGGGGGRIVDVHGAGAGATLGFPPTAAAAGAHSAAFRGHPAAFSFDPSAISNSGFGGGVGFCGYSPGFGGGSLSSSSSGSGGGSGSGGEATILLPDGGGMSRPAGCGSALMRETWGFASRAGVESELRDVSTKERRQQSDSNESGMSKQHKKMRHWVNHNSKPAQATHADALLSASSPCSFPAADGMATAAAADNGEHQEPTPGYDGDDDNGDLPPSLDIDAGSGSGGITLADTWMGLETIVGGIEPWHGGDDADEEQFDSLAVFAFEDHFGML